MDNVKKKNNKEKVVTNSMPQNIKDSVVTPLNEKEINEYLYYTSQIMNVYSGSAGYPQTFTPLLTNERLQEIGFTPAQIDIGLLKKALKDPIVSDNILTAYSEWLRFSEPISKRVCEYIGNLPSFDMTYTCINPPKEFSDKEYKEDLQVFKNICFRFDYKSEFAKINRRTVVEDSYFGLFRMDAGYRFVFQELPSPYCLITGKNADWGFTYDFDMTWFLKQGISIDQYPRAMKILWRRVYGEKSLEDVQRYNPSNLLDRRNGVFSTWAQTSPLPEKGGFTCFKFNSDIYAKIPFLTALFNDAISKDVIRELQNNAYIIASQKILVGLIPYLKDVKGGSVKDQIALDPNTLKLYLGLLKEGLNSAVKVSGVPFSDVKDIAYTLPQNNMYNQYSNTMSGSSGVTSRLVYSTDKMSATEVEYSSNIDEMLSLQVYPQYATWFSTLVNSFTKKYKFQIRFSGSNFRKSRETRFKNAETLANRGMFLPQLYSNALGMSPFEFENMLKESKESDIQKWLQLPLNANTTAQQIDGVGRPRNEIASDSQDRNLDRTEDE